MPARKKIETGIVVPEEKSYMPRDKKPKKHYRQGYMDGKGRMVSPEPIKNEILPQQQRKDVLSFHWRPDNWTMYAIEMLCQKWECNRHECMRRIMNPIAREALAALREGSTSFSVDVELEFDPKAWTTWRAR